MLQKRSNIFYYYAITLCRVSRIDILLQHCQILFPSMYHMAPIFCKTNYEIVVGGKVSKLTCICAPECDVLAVCCSQLACTQLLSWRFSAICTKVSTALFSNCSLLKWETGISWRYLITFLSVTRCYVMLG